MRKRWMAVMMAAALLGSQPISALAAGSVSTSPVISHGGGSGGGGGGGGRAGRDYGSGAKTGDQASGGSGVTVAGAEANGTMTIGKTQVGFVTGAGATAGLPEGALASINAINAGTAPLEQATGYAGAAGYAALTSVQAIVAKDVTTQEESREPVNVTLYVPNLVEGLKDVELLYYSNATGQWQLLKPSKVDFESRQVSVDITGSGSFTVVYKK